LRGSGGISKVKRGGSTASILNLINTSTKGN